jgi:hypothetical protein
MQRLCHSGVRAIPLQNASQSPRDHAFLLNCLEFTRLMRGSGHRLMPKIKASGRFGPSGVVV